MLDFASPEGVFGQVIQSGDTTVVTASEGVAAIGADTIRSGGGTSAGRPVAPYEPQPYATLIIDPYLYSIQSRQQKHHLGAVAFDRENGILYVLEPLADEEKSLIQV